MAPTPINPSSRLANILHDVAASDAARTNHKQVENLEWATTIEGDVYNPSNAPMSKGLGYPPPDGSLSNRAQSLADKNERDGRMRAMDPAIMRVAAGFPVSKADSAAVQSDEKSTMGVELPKGSFASQAQSAADLNWNDGGLRSIYDVE
ncbi:hypothetical protein M422DRAFT_34840 [Sphaerobolus stellatus SS14]|uniref:SMP domain-containing protein n=1 Tax=Sphaerobolus stellatus (strain SS14) TaxID=990650 RepID=A0A0C9UJ49_SPHS4|nr:hypothetical protein M422DRAFT_34840 [Sphaerobolus stellatus SS14]